jgi:hypothetical protein
MPICQEKPRSPNEHLFVVEVRGESGGIPQLKIEMWATRRLVRGKEPKNAFYPATGLPGSTALPFVISTGA